MTYDWPKLKPEIIDLYLNQNLTLDEVTTRIARDHGQWIRNRTIREKLREWGCRKVDFRGRRKSKASTISADSGYATLSPLSRTTTVSTNANSWHASTTTLISPGLSNSPSIKSEVSPPSSIVPRSSPKAIKHKPLPPDPPFEPGDLDTILQPKVAPTPTAIRLSFIRPSTVPPHAPASQCSRAIREANVSRVATLGKCSECGASTLHSIVAGAMALSYESYCRLVEKNKASINSRDIFGNTPLHVAAASGYGVAEFKLLQGAGADLLARNEKGELFLHLIGAHHKDNDLLGILEWATAQKLDFSLSTFDGKTVLHTLCERNITFWALTNMWPFLRSYATDINSRDRWGKTAVDHLKDSVTLEIQQGANPGEPATDPAQGLENLLALHLPKYERSHDNVVAFQDDFNVFETAWDPAGLAQSDMTMLNIVQQSEGKPSAQDADGKNALHCLARIIRFGQFSSHQCGPTEARHDGVRKCLFWKVDPNAYDRHGSTPLHSFLSYLRFNEFEASLARIVQTLLENGADPGMRDRDGNTALHLACHHGRVSCVDVLLNFLRKDARLHSRAIRARNDKDRSPVRETRNWMNMHTPEERELRLQCISKIEGEEFTEAHVRPTFWGIPNSTPVPDVTMPPPSMLRSPTPTMDLS